VEFFSFTAIIEIVRVLVSGAKGMVALAVTAHCTAQGDEVFALTREELDISDRTQVYRAFEKLSPEVVFNCAAYTDVDGAETNEAAAYAANAVGPENLAAASRELGATFLTISTDYVFDGTKVGFYNEEDLPNPQGVYARSKYEGELRCRKVNTDSIIIRTGWIFGHGGTNFLSKVPEMLAAGKPFKAINDSYGTPTFANDLAARMRELAIRKDFGVFHVVNSGRGASYFEFALDAARVFGIEKPDVDQVSDADLTRPALRPRNSRLSSLKHEKLGLKQLRDWKAALTAFILER
jgi:dTDP-4-dehydrorhamnose reductase